MGLFTKVRKPRSLCSHAEIKYPIEWKNYNLSILTFII